MSSLPLNIDWQQILLHLFNFVILAGGLYILLYKPVTGFMEKRTEYFRSMDEEAKKKLREAEDRKESYEKSLSEIREQAEEEQAAAMKKAAAESEALLEETKAKADKLLSDARKQAKAEHDKMIADAGTEIAGLVEAATRKTLMDSTKAAYDQFLDAAEGGREDE